MISRTKNITQQLESSRLFPLLIRLTIPATIAQLVNALYSLVDRMYIGHMPGTGAIALSGIGLTFPITMMISAFSCLPGMGGAPLASIALGQGDSKKAQQILCNAASLLLAVSFALTLLCSAFLRPLLILFGADAQTMPYALDYLQTYLLGTLFVELSFGLNPFINAQGFVLTGTISVVIGAILNIVLDPILIYTLDMGIRGAAIATVFSQFISCLWVIGFLSSRHSLIRLNWRDMLPDRAILRSICALGISPFTFRVNESLIVILINRLLLYYGGSDANLHLASMAILNSIGQIFFMPLLGIVTGLQPILSYNYGARNYIRVRSSIRCARILSLSCAILMWGGLMLFPRAICLLFTEDAVLTDLTEKTIRLMFSTSFVLGLQMINQNAFVAMGNTRFSFLFGIMRKVLLLIPLALILPHFFGVWGVYAAEMISNPVTTLLTHAVFQRFLAAFKRETCDTKPCSQTP